ncbi:AraC family transcriptional regulator [uncultured Megasphaera sp.]|uniref:AraC family transcriptional regulator n=1 Tax=uncultured Megasphaera sp. TaxID=165188 RepID=UPI0025E6974B|nr:AraC family transcriptional regulator [uncultured Megasphaera sp.]
MEIRDKGVVPPSFMGFSIPSSFARQALYYTPEFGHFYCQDKYHVERLHLDSSLLMFVKSGAFYAESREQKAVAHAGEILLLDCRYAHSYGCQETGDFLWFHFRGAESIAYTGYLFEKNGLLFTGENVPLLEPTFKRVLSMGHYTLQRETVLSHRIDRILMTLANLEDHSQPVNEILTPVLQYIQEHYAESIELDSLANLCMLSSSHFIRTFKKHLGCTPHEYLLQYRLLQSKHLLQTTSDSIEVIAEKCGFNSASHFARAFKNVNHMTPTDFRHLDF